MIHEWPAYQLTMGFVMGLLFGVAVQMWVRLLMDAAFSVALAYEEWKKERQ